MDEEATQPTQQATQIIVDPRRLGQAGSEISHEDLADICCILHPASKSAYKGCQHIHETNPELTIATSGNVKIRENLNGTLEDVETFELAEDGIEPHDLVLRLSAKLKDPAGGFHFGRNAQRCDFIIGDLDPTRRISNVHFRIFINEYGVLMLEDQSTNGTAVDGYLLRGKDKENNVDYRHTLINGSSIIITMTPPEKDWKFHVRIPHRELDSDNDAYQKNLTAFFLRKAKFQKGKDEPGVEPKDNFKKPPLNLFPTAGDAPATPAGRAPAGSGLPSVGRPIKEWRGGAKYNKVGCIGKGAFAVVYKLTARFDGVPYAAKELEKRRFMKNGVLDQKVDMEMKIMRKIQHPNVVRYIEHIDWEEYLYIIMEFVPGGDLGTLINREQLLPESDVKIMAYQLLDALKYLHNMKITHRDVKPDNILIQARDPLQVKLTDFGLSKMIDSEETFLRTFCGTLLYCAPEVYSEYREYDQHTGQRNRRDKKSFPKQRYGQAVDIWSLAGVLFYALCGSPPYPVQNGTSYQELLNRIMTQPLDLRPLQHAGVSENGIRFVRSMLRTHPEYRATIDELERSSWFTGVDSQQFSLEEDDLDLIGDGHVDVELEAETSQLSINPDDTQIDDIDDVNHTSDLTEVLPLEIPASFDTSEGNVSVDESYGFMKENINPRTQRLFGEVTTSALGSSGAFPRSQLNLPLSPRQPHPTDSLELHSEFAVGAPGDSRIDNSLRNLSSTAAFQPTIAAPPLLTPLTTQYPEVIHQAIRSSSLMGAESMVGHLNMHSPGSATSPVASPVPETQIPNEHYDTQLPSQHHNTQIPTQHHGTQIPSQPVMPAVSLRRLREEDTDDDELWRPADLPAKRQRVSARQIDVPVPPSIFWDPKDKSTHHNNYPRMSTAQFQTYKQYARSKGEKFTHGFKTFEKTMESFRSSRSPSASLTEYTRANSEPVKDNRRMIMKRDERKLEEVANGPSSNAYSDSNTALDRLLPSTAHPSRASPGVETNSSTSSPSPQPLVGNDFQPPKRILAKFLATSDSCLPTLSFNITESITSWGRGMKNTIRYSNGQETRIPKYAFKVFLFKPGFKYTNPSLRTTQPWQDRDQDMSFYISSKASTGIWINGVNLESYDRQNPATESKFWGKLQHGDVVDIWRNDTNHNKFTRFRFECYWGQSKEVRTLDNPFVILPQGAFLNELEIICLEQEQAMLAEYDRRAREERAAVRQDEQDKIDRLVKTGPHQK